MNSYHGMLIVNKPYGMISKDVSRWLTKRLGRLRLGHVGTLDPLAEGVLPILFGKATRLQDHLLDLDKGYQFDVTFGKETDTLDLEGDVVKEALFNHITAEQLIGISKKLLGPIEQIPPIYSMSSKTLKPLP
jgi:tRNA pseudouridine55 synthase